MKTDELVRMLATNAGPVEEHATKRRFATALGWGVFGSMLVMAVMLGVRPDIQDAILMPMFWMKLAFPLAGAAAAVYAATRLARPGMRAGKAWWVIGALLLIVWMAGAVTLIQAPPAQREYLVFGETWRECPFNIALISVPVFAAAMWAMKGLAPTRPTLAGAVAGLVAGTLSTAIYALHCPEMETPFLAIWYVLGTFVPVAAGALIGRRLLRW